YTLGICFGSRLGANWSFRHFTVLAPAGGFERFAPTFAAMLGSYRINGAWARSYIQQGMARLHQMQQQTAERVARNAEEIHATMQAACDERSRSQDYLDYQRTNFIRGQQDWVSDMEGGTVYHTDSWGTQNTTTDERWEGQPFDYVNYVNYTGKNPKYNEQMTAIDSRELWEQHIRGQ
ncbi:MAG TPA: hypothetical protein VMS93_07970, partial [Candidatus Saccharimonadales bacterium]|nr:hypothetical protein [Candidatus Saccharimonadales bacterium]